MRGVVSADWLVSITIFLVFISFAFVQYAAIMREKATPAIDVTEFIADQVGDYILIDTYGIPVRYNAMSSGTTVLYFDYNWPNGMPGSARVLFSGASQTCYLDGNRLYWQSDVSVGDNDFIVRYADLDVPDRCDTPLAGGEQVIPLSEEYCRMISQERWDQMNATPFETFKSDLDITQNFRVELNVSGTTYSYGPPAPTLADVHAVNRFGRLEETGEQANLRILVW